MIQIKSIKIKRMKKILVGSNAFFKDFKSKDKDYLIFIDNQEDFKIRKEICLRGTDIFYYKRLSPKKLMTLF